MGNIIYKFEWMNQGRICHGAMTIINDDLILTCTDTQNIKWLQHLEKICFQYDKTIKKAVCIIDDISSILTVDNNKLVLKINKKFSAGHIRAIFFWTDQCEATIKFDGNLYSMIDKIKF